MRRLRRAQREVINQINRMRLKNRDFSLISSNCNGCLILHDLNLRYNSPFVNTGVFADDFIKMLGNLRHYLESPLQLERIEGNLAYCALDDITVILAHFKDVEEELEKWNQRVKRVDYDNLFIMFTDRDGCTEEHLKAFDALPYKNKVVFTHRPYPELKSAVYIKGFEQEEYVGELYKYRCRWLGWKYYDAFDYVSWFNGGKE